MLVKPLPYPGIWFANKFSLHNAVFKFQDPRIEDALGAPIKGYGEETTRRRRTHVSHAVYEKEGAKHMRMRFYIKGIRNKAVVELDMKQVIIIVSLQLSM